MDEVSSNNPPKDAKVYATLGDFFDDLCPQVMAIGVSYDDFWHGDPAIVRFAIESEEIRQRNGVVRNDILAWNTGRYVMLGVGVVLSQAFSRNSQAKYPTEPLIATQIDDALADQKRDRDLRLQEAQFLAVAAMLDKQNQTGASAN